MDFFIPRTCKELKHAGEFDRSRPIGEFRSLDAYVLLGDPGAGKTLLFQREAEAIGGLYITARNFLALDFGESVVGRTLFIDGLDETRVGSGDYRGPLDRIRARLQKLGQPNFRLSCRDADWLGDTDRDALSQVSPSGQLHTLQLELLSDEGILQFLDNYLGTGNGKEFVQSARLHGVDDLLNNPQTLVLLAEALRDGAWPNSRAETYELACRQLAREVNDEHQAVKRSTKIRTDSLLDAAGYLSALILLADRPCVTYDALDPESVSLQDLAIDPDLPLEEALQTRLFTCTRQSHYSPVHRSVAEFLAARYLGQSLQEGAVPLHRVLALMIGADGGVVSGLRGLHAWLARSCKSHRQVLIERDPLGVVLYGDVRAFSTEEKFSILSELGGQAQEYAGFRWQDWSSTPFGALSSKDMIPVFHEILSSSSRKEAHQAFVSCVLDALQWGDPIPELAPLLISIVRDSSYWSINRKAALDAFQMCSDKWAAAFTELIKDINSGLVDDNDDELIGRLLDTLYPNYIGPDEVLDYLHPEKDKHLLGSYMMFWGYGLATNSSSEHYPILLDSFVEIDVDWAGQRHEYLIKKFIGEMLSRGLEKSDTGLIDERLAGWLGTGLDKYGHPMLELEHAERVRKWISEHPNRYKGVLAHLLKTCYGSDHIRYCFHKCKEHLYRADLPPDLGLWYLARADSCPDEGLAEQFLEEAVSCLFYETGHEGLSIENLQAWVQSRPKFSPVLGRMLQSEIPEWRFEHALDQAKHDVKRKHSVEETNKHLREIIDDIRAGTANVNTFHYLANAYFGRFYECSGDTHVENLSSILGGDQELLSSALKGFTNTLLRNDLPTVEEIASTHAESRVHSVGTPCLAGAIEISKNDSEAILLLDDNVLSRLVCFSYADGTSDTPKWLECLHRHRPELVAAALVQYASLLLRKHAKHISGLYSLAHDEAAASIAKDSVLPLLRAFGASARKHQSTLLDYLLRAALQHCDINELLALVRSKLQLKSLSVWQRTYWLACGIIIDSEEFGPTLSQFIGDNLLRAKYASSFLCDDRDSSILRNQDEFTVSYLIQLLGPFFSPHVPTDSGFVSGAMRASDSIQHLINHLSASTSEHAAYEIEKMLLDNELSQWHQRLKHSLYAHRVTRREAFFVHPDLVDVQNTLANGPPANAADLSALTTSVLKELATHIRNANTDAYKQFWNTDQHKRPTTARVEDLCRNTLLDMLQQRLTPFGVDAQREGSYVDEGRADIRVSYVGTRNSNVPVEVKRDKHPDVWTAIHEQLIQQYVRDPGAEGFGIYVVFWFGEELRPPPSGNPKPNSATGLESALTEMLSIDERKVIKVIVIDVEKPR